MLRIVCRLLIVFFFCGYVAEIHAEEAPTSYQVQMEVRVPLRDGVNLNATVYRPDSLKDPLPVIFLFTPYPEDTTHPSGAYFAAHGYIYAVVDVRGRGDSEGVFDPFAHEGQDGYDIVEWFAKQPWCNGKVAMFGGSYAGGDQWLTAMMRPPHLTTIVPVASARGGADLPPFLPILIPYPDPLCRAVAGPYKGSRSLFAGL
jgi:predicted acyl esterase